MYDLPWTEMRIWGIAKELKLKVLLVSQEAERKSVCREHTVPAQRGTMADIASGLDFLLSLQRDITVAAPASANDKASMLKASRLNE